MICRECGLCHLFLGNLKGFQLCGWQLLNRLLSKGMVPSERDLNELNDQAEAALQSSNRFIQKAAYNAQGRLWECTESGGKV